MIFNKSLTEGYFPNTMKHAEVIPLYKAKNKEIKNNYRPISLLITISKILEKIIYSRTYQFLDKNNLIYHSQYGFRSKHSCENAIQELIGNIVKGKENGKHSLSVFLDLSKAFDTLDHSILLQKLEKYGIRGTALSWFSSYLNNRTMNVKVLNASGNTCYSEGYDLPIGAPQGSCLGPLLFLIYTNDLHKHISFCSCILFADDTTLYHTSKNINYLRWCVESDLKSISNWFKAHKLTLNIEKSTVLFFHCSGKQIKMDLKIDGTCLPQAHLTKFLGVWIDDNLTWNTHTEKLLCKLKRNKQLLRNCKNILNVHSKKILYFAQIQSNITYRLVVWGNMISNTKRKKIESLIRNCKELIANKHVPSKDLEVANLSQLLDIENKKLGHKLVNKLLPKTIHEIMNSDNMNRSLKKTHVYETRNKNIPRLPKASASVYYQSYLFQSVSSYYTVPVATRNLVNPSMFTKAIKKSLIYE